jgi:hypothetical protein
MPNFDISIFSYLLRTANPSYSHHKESSLSPLENYLRTLGPVISPANIDTIQRLWAFVPREKQLKYITAGAYMRQFVPHLVDAIPVSPKMEYKQFKVWLLDMPGILQYPMRFYHVHKLTWQSSNGYMASLFNVGTRERVTHRTSPAGPPFNALVNVDMPMSFTQGATTNNGADTGYNFDDHSIGNPSIIVGRPLTTGSVIADQIYEYTTDGINWHTIYGTSFVIEKGVRMQGGQHVFFFRKQNVPPAQSFHFEIEYPIGVAPAVAANKKIPKWTPAHANEANIRNYANRIIKLG